MQVRAGLDRTQPGPAAELRSVLNTAPDAEVSPDPFRSSTNAKFFARVEGESRAGMKNLAITSKLKRRTVNDASRVCIRSHRRSDEANFQGRSVGGIADQSVAQS